MRLFRSELEDMAISRNPEKMRELPPFLLGLSSAFSAEYYKEIQPEFLVA